ncbi:MAG: OmpA family protein [Candidatus Binatia bacterium]
MKRVILSALAMYATLSTGLPYASAQTVHDLTGHRPTREEFKQILTPRMRGIAPIGAEPAATCSEYRQATLATRGIALAGATPVADIAAIRVTFAFDSAELTPETIPTLRELGEALKSSGLNSSCIQIEGHTDNIGSDEYNVRLSERRAQSVIRYLTEQVGVNVEHLVAVGKGEHEPIADNTTETGRQKNRRVQVMNLGYAKTVAFENR